MVVIVTMPSLHINLNALFINSMLASTTGMCKPPIVYTASPMCRQNVSHFVCKSTIKLVAKIRYKHNQA